MDCFFEERVEIDDSELGKYGDHYQKLALDTNVIKLILTKILIHFWSEFSKTTSNSGKPITKIYRCLFHKQK